MTLTTKELSLMGMLVALNVAVGGLVHIIKAPIFLDAIGTIVAVLLLGLAPGVLVGVLTFAVAAAIVSPVYIWFIGTQAAIATVAYFAASKFTAFRTPWRVVAAGIVLGIVAGVASAPIIVTLFGGVAGSGRDLITAVLLSSGRQVYKAVLLSGMASEPIDKVLQMLAAFYVLKSLPKSLLEQFRNPILEKNGFL